MVYMLNKLITPAEDKNNERPRKNYKSNRSYLYYCRKKKHLKNTKIAQTDNERSKHKWKISNST